VRRLPSSTVPIGSSSVAWRCQGAFSQNRGALGPDSIASRQVPGARARHGERSRAAGQVDKNNLPHNHNSDAC
jgi:hypothetical protein